MRFLRIMVLAICAFVLVAEAYAVPEGEKAITVDGGFRFARANAAGPQLVEFWADGDAEILLISTSQEAPAVVVRRRWPSADFGDATFRLKANTPRPFVTQGASVDSVFVNLVTATEVLVTWTNAN